MTRERGGGLIFLAAGMYGVAFSIPHRLGEWNQPGPAVFPLALSILLCVFGVWWIIQGKERGEPRKTEDAGAIAGRYHTPLKIVGLSAAFVFALEPLGYALTATLYVFGLFLWVCRYPLWFAAVVAASVGAGSWLFFGKLLSTPLPRGFLL